MVLPDLSDPVDQGLQVDPVDQGLQVDLADQGLQVDLADQGFPADPEFLVDSSEGDFHLLHD